MALQEMLAQKHRILPVMIGAIAELKQSMNTTLEKLLKSVTWIEYPGAGAAQRDIDKFWTRLVLSLPKKRHRAVCE